MDQHKFERIDKGIKRPRVPRNDHDQETGKFLPVVEPERRALIIKEAIGALAHGQTTDQVAAQHDITGACLRYWLLADANQEANASRKVYLDSELSACREEIRIAADPFTLARAREDGRYVQWLAERRLPEVYGPKQEVKHTGAIGPLINIQLSGTVSVEQLPQSSIEHNPALVPSDPDNQ